MSKASWKNTACWMTPNSTRSSPANASRSGPSRSIPIQVTHSLVDCVALAIHTPLGVLIHTGDFKVDPTPTDNRLFDLHAFAEYGKQGVLALFQDSTNVERRGYTPSERAVRARFEEIFARTKRRLFISCFSSSIHRIKLAMEMAFENGRKVALVGRSMMESTEIAQDLGYIDVPDGTADPSRTDSRPAAGKSLRPDQRHAGRAHVGAVARGGGQPQACAHSERATPSCCRRASFPATKKRFIA